MTAFTHKRSFIDGVKTGWEQSMQEIDLLKGELEEMNELSKKECREHALFAHATGERIGALEGQLSEAETANLAIRLERNQAVAQLHAELSEARVEFTAALLIVKNEARQEAARECLEIIECEDVYKFQKQKIKAKFKLEG